MSKFINFISEKMLHVNKTSDGKEFVNVSFPCAESKTGYASFGVNLGQVLDAKKHDGTVVSGYKSILLGDAEKTRKVSIATNKKGTNYKNIELTNAQIAAEFENSRKTYKAATVVATA